MLWDVELLRRYAGEDLDPAGPLSSDIYCTAAETDASLLPTVGPVMGMLTTPASLSTIDERVRGMLQQGWRPGFTPGTTRDELVERMSPLALSPTAS